MVMIWMEEVFDTFTCTRVYCVRKILLIKTHGPFWYVFFVFGNLLVAVFRVDFHFRRHRLPTSIVVFSPRAPGMLGLQVQLLFSRLMNVWHLKTWHVDEESRKARKMKKNIQKAKKARARTDWRRALGNWAGKKHNIRLGRRRFLRTCVCVCVCYYTHALTRPYVYIVREVVEFLSVCLRVCVYVCVERVKSNISRQLALSPELLGSKAAAVVFTELRCTFMWEKIKYALIYRRKFQ